MEQKLITNTLINAVGYVTHYTKYVINTSSPYKKELYALNEFGVNLSAAKKLTFFRYFFFINFTLTDWDSKAICVSNLVIKDLINLNTIWRLIKGYPTHGQRTHSNRKTSKKNKLLNTYRLNQFFNLFGHRKRNIYPTLIICEYTNKLWYLNWNMEWLQATLFAMKLVKPKVNQVPFDPVKLAQNFTNGYTREGAASKIGKSKKITKVATVGLPIFFSRWLYFDIPPKEFPFKLWISDDDRRKMGKKKKSNLKKKKN